MRVVRYFNANDFYNMINEFRRKHGHKKNCAKFDYDRAKAIYFVYKDENGETGIYNFYIALTKFFPKMSKVLIEEELRYYFGIPEGEKNQ